MPEEKIFIPLMLWDPRFDIELLNYAFLKRIYFIGYGLNNNLFYHGKQWHMQTGADHDYHHGAGQMLLDVYQPIYDYASKNKDKKLMYSLFWMWHEVKFNLKYRREILVEEVEEGDFPKSEPAIFLQKRINSFNILTLKEKIKYIVEKSQKDEASFDFLSFNPIVAEMDDEKGRLNYYKSFIYPSKALKITWIEEDKVDKVIVELKDKNFKSFNCLSYTAFCKDRIGAISDEISFLKDFGINIKNPYKLEEGKGQLFMKDTSFPYIFHVLAVIPQDWNSFGKELNTLFKEHIFNHLYNLADKIAKDSEKIIN